MPQSKGTQFVLLFSIVTLGIFTNVVSSEQYTGNVTGGPYEFIHHLTPYFPEFAPYVKLQMELENIADEKHLHDLPKGKKNVAIRKLLMNSRVRNLVNQCRKFHEKPAGCESSLYMTENGRCNNLDNPEWGSAGTAQARLLPAFYEGSSGFRLSVSGKPLPSAREVKLATNSNNSNSRLTAIFVVFGQAIAHDMVLTPRLYADDTENICKDPSFLKYQIFYDADDPFYSKFNVTCGSFFRNSLFPSCNFDKRNILNMATAIIDASDFYGSSEKKAQELRARDNSGKLLMQNSDKGGLLLSRAIRDIYCLKNSPQTCLNSGDGRSNQHTLLATFDTIFTRLHNLFADKFHEVNPHWDGEKIYQEARRLIAAVYHQVAYNNYLPLLLGPELMHKYDLYVTSPSQYDTTVNPAQLIEFSTAAYRLHPMVPHVMSLYNTTSMESTFSFTEPLFQGELGYLLAGSTRTACDKYGTNIRDDLRNNMLKPHEARYGLDIASTNIQRGRDHGLPPYVDMVRYCNEDMDIQDFDDLLQHMPEENVDNLRSTYEDVADIDLWVGMISEHPVAGGEVGPTAGCVIGEQFRRVKFGDSFFFTHANGRNPFTEAQLEVIRTFSLSKVACLVSKPAAVPKYAMEMPNEKNFLVSCDELSQIDFTPWKEVPK